MKNEITYNGKFVKLTGESYDNMFEIEYQSGKKQFVHIEDLFFHGDYLRSNKYLAN